MFEVSVSAGAEGVLVEAAGDVDMLTAGELRRTLYAAVASAGAGPVVLDLSGVRFLDSTGVQALIDGYHHAMVAGGTLTVRGVQRGPARVLNLVGLSKLFGLEPAADRFAPLPPDARDAAAADAVDPDQPR